MGQYAAYMGIHCYVIYNVLKKDLSYITRDLLHKRT